MLPALRLEPHSAFLAAYRLSRLCCPEALERSTTLNPEDPFAIPPGLTGRPTIPPHLLPELPADERRARRLALLLDSDDPEIRDWAQAEYLKLGHSTRSLVREGVFEVKVTLEGADEPITEDWSANEREDDLDKLRERLERQKERREEHEEVEREMVWAREMFGKWLIDGRVDAVFRLAAGVLNELLKELARDEGEEWVADEVVGEAADDEEQPTKSSTLVPTSGDLSSKSTLATSKTLGADQVAPMRPSPAPSVASSKRRVKQLSEPAKEAEKEPEPELELEPEPEPELEQPAPEADPESKIDDEPVMVDSPQALSQAEPSPEQSPLPVPVPLPVLHPSIFSEEGLLTYAINSIHPDPPREPTPPVEPPRPESKLSSSNQTVTPQDQDHAPNLATVQHDTYADFYSKDPRRRKTPLLHVKPLPNNQPLPPKPEKEYDSYADFYANDSRLMRHVDDRPLPALVKKEAARAAERERASRPQSTSKPSKPDHRTSRPQSSSKPSKPDDRASRPQSSAKPSKLAIPSKAAADPPRLVESKHQRRSSSRHRQRHKSPSSFDDFAVASNISGDSGRLTTPAPSVARSRSRSRSREHHRSSHRKSGHRSRRHSPGLTSPTPSHASRRRRDSRSARREAAPLPVPSPAPKLTPGPAPKRSWVPFRISGGAASPASSNASDSRAPSPEPVPVMPRGSPYNATMTLASDAGGGRERDGGGGEGEGGGAAAAAAGEEAVVPPAPPLPPVQFWLPGFPAYKASVAGHSGDDNGDGRHRRRRHRDQASSSSASLSSVTMSSSASSRLLPPPPPVVAPPPVFLALGARRACVPYTPAFQGIDLRVVRPLSAREKLAMRDAVCVLVRLGARVICAEAGGLGVRGEMWSLSYVGF